MKRIYIIGNNQFSRTNETDVMSGQFFSMGIAERGESILPSEVATVDEAARMGLGVDDILPPELHKNQFMADLANINYKKIDLKKFNISNLFPSVEMNLLTINQLFNLKKIKNYALALITFILIMNIFGVANLVNNNLKIMNINDNKKELFLSFFPDKAPINIELEINNK